jgi:hypothetical protein
VRNAILCMMAVLFVFAPRSIAAPVLPEFIEIQPMPVVERGPLQVRLLGPYAQPAPRLSIHVATERITIRTDGQDYVLPGLPPVPYVQSSIAAPIAGRYDLELVQCGHPQLPCSTLALGTLQIEAIAAIPAGSYAGWAALILGLLLFATRSRGHIRTCDRFE